MQILIIDNTIDQDAWGAGEICAMARLSHGATIHVRRAPHEDLPPDSRRYDRILISGSKTSVEERAPWIDRLDQYVRRQIDHGTPILGVCYGHQTVARALGGRELLRRAPRGEFGWSEVEVVHSETTIFDKLPAKFHTFQWHNDEVTTLPPGTHLLARSETCPIQAFELTGRPVFGVQFHPERGLEAGEVALDRRFKLSPHLRAVNRGKGKKVFDEKIGENLFRNFLSLGVSS